MSCEHGTGVPHIIVITAIVAACLSEMPTREERTEMNDSDKLQAICADRDAHRAEIVAEKADLLHLLFAFLAFAAAAAGVYWDESIVKDLTARSWLLFAAAQIEFLLALFCLQLIVDLATHSAYVGALEKKINEIVGESATFWESGLIRTHYLTWHSAAYWNAAVLVFMFVSLFFVLMGLAAARAQSRSIVVVLVVEFLVYILMAAAACYESRRVRKIAESMINLRKHQGRGQTVPASK